MKILWLTNIILPQISMAIGKPISAFGGWLSNMAESLGKDDDIEFHFCFAVSNGEHHRGVIDGINYHSFTRYSAEKCRKQNELEFESLLREIQPDIIHIFGTEYGHTLAMVNACHKVGLEEKVVISIQGLLHVYQTVYYAHLPWSVVNSWTVRDLLRLDNIRWGSKRMLKRGKNEIKALQKVQHVIGRTDWDEACVKRINSYVNYHFCNESLRNAFYENAWSIKNIEKHSIFVSQCNYPIKGFHLMLEAMADIVKRYPDAHLYTTGKNPLQLNFKGKLRQGSYSKYIAILIRKYHLEDKITFLGTLNEQAMADRFLKSHVFVSPSSIENSPNSVGEAMILGVPIVSSDVGGVKNMLEHELEGYIYPADEPYMIAYYVDKVFSDRDNIQKISERSRAHAKKTHNRDKNYEDLIRIYQSILKK